MDDSPLGRLPPELRNTIYELALTQKVPLSIGHQKPRRERAKQPVALLQTCRQIHAECAQILYARNEFEFTLDTGLNSSGDAAQSVFGEYENFCQGIGPTSAAFIDTVTFRCGNWRFVHMDTLCGAFKRLMDLARKRSGLRTSILLPVDGLPGLNNTPHGFSIDCVQPHDGLTRAFKELAEVHSNTDSNRHVATMTLLQAAVRLCHMRHEAVMREARA